MMNKNGLTLAELLVATILMGIIMVGVASFSYTVKRMQDSTSRASVLAMSTAGAMTHMTKNAARAVGEQDDLGIDLAADDSSMAFRQDRNETPDDYTDDVWIIYVVDTNTLSVCEDADDAIPEPANCTGANSTVLTQQLDPNNLPVFEFTTDEANLQMYIDITLNTIFAPGDPVSPVTNPTYSMTTRVTPAGHSW